MQESLVIAAALPFFKVILEPVKNSLKVLRRIG